MDTRHRIQALEIEEKNDEIYVFEDNMKRLYHHIGDKIMNTIQMDPQHQKVLTDMSSYRNSDNLKAVYNSIKKLQNSFIKEGAGLKFVEEQNLVFKEI